jgi:hypothetical protein
MFRHATIRCHGKVVTVAHRYPAGVMVVFNKCERCKAIEFLPDQVDKTDNN